jgi:hypothetical protein
MRKKIGEKQQVLTNRLNARLIMAVAVFSRYTTDKKPEASPAPSLCDHYIRA